jgi:Transposase, Mutator family
VSWSGWPGAGAVPDRAGRAAEAVETDSTGQAGIDVPRDWAGTFEPQIVRERQRRLNGVDEIVLSLYGKGLTTGEMSAHFQPSSTLGSRRQINMRIPADSHSSSVTPPSRPSSLLWAG